MGLDQLYGAYNKSLARLRKMEQWEKTASHEEQLRFQGNVNQVVDDCSKALNAIRAYREVTTDEVLNGFHIN